MSVVELKIARIGNSRGVRLPAAALRKYGIGNAVVMEERSDGILLRSPGPAIEKLSWDETARAMAAEAEEWRDLEVANARRPRRDSRGRPRGDGPVKGAHEPQALKRYEIRWATLDPARGSEMAKRRPVVIVSLDALNERLSTVTVCPLTSQLHPTWRSRLQVRAAGQPAEIAVDQIRTISKERLGRKLGALTAEEAATLRRLITEMYGE